MELIDRLKEVLKEEFNICSDEELLEAVQSMPELDLGIFVTPLKGDNNAKSAYFDGSLKMNGSRLLNSLNRKEAI